MCDNIKDVLYKPIAQDSRTMEKFGDAIGSNWLKEEGHKNTANPGRAAGKALGYAASWYAGGLLGGAGAGAGAAAEAGTAAAETAAEQATIEAAKNAAEQGTLKAVEGYSPASIANAIKTGVGSAKQGLLDLGRQAMAGGYNAMVPGVGPEQAAMLAEQTGPFGLQGLGKTMEAAGSANGLNSMQQFAAKAGGLLGRFGQNAADPKNQAMMKAGMGLLSPQQPQGPPPAPPPRQQGAPAPLSMPYQNTDLNSMKPPGMSMEEWLKRKQMGLLGGM